MTKAQPEVLLQRQTNLKPKLWGPHLWKALHAITFGYPTNPGPLCQRQYKEFFTSLKHVLPCRECRRHYSKMVTHPKYKLGSSVFKSKDALVRWLVKAHNAVNIRKNKKCMKLDNVRSLYAGWSHRPKAPR